jgi:type I restriction-modification system DNA methylase subunit
MNAKIKPIIDLLDSFQFKIDYATLLSDVFSMLADTISNAVDSQQKSIRDEEYFACLKHYDEKDRKKIQTVAGKIFDLCSEMSEPEGEFNDWLGELYMCSNTSSSRAGQFFTPFNLSRLCARLNAFKKDNHGIITVDEPACGSGGLLLATAEKMRDDGINYTEEAFFHGADIDGRCVRMCYIQLSLAGVPAVIHKRDTLSMKTYETWFTPAYCFNWMKFGRYGRC